jgi:hypothetical protein
MPATQVLAPPDDGRLYPAELLDKYRGRDASSRMVVRFTTEPDATYVPADDLPIGLALIAIAA